MQSKGERAAVARLARSQRLRKLHHLSSSIVSERRWLPQIFAAPYRKTSTNDGAFSVALVAAAFHGHPLRH
jgi:hypothetical protein